jgi:ketosteroid isomerase-like protein
MATTQKTSCQHPELQCHPTRGMLESAERGQKIVSRQSYGIENAIGQGDRVALEVAWVGTIEIPVGTLPAGSEMRAHFAVFLEFRNGKIIRQRNYDCFDPW